MTFVLHRTLHLTNPLEHGQDVAELQKLLNAKGFHLAVDGIYGAHTADEVMAAKRALKYPAAMVVPIAGELLVSKLQAYTPPPQPLLDPKLKAFADLCRWAVGNTAAIHYAQTRPIPVHLPYKTLPLTTDCSGSVTLLAKWAGLPDPNGLVFNGEGFTGTMLQHGRRITRAQVRPADLCVFGNYPGHHVIAALSNGTGEWFSHGQESDPRLTTFEDEARFQPAAATFLRFTT